MEKLSNTEFELKKSVAYKKKRLYRKWFILYQMYTRCLAVFTPEGSGIKPFLKCTLLFLRSEKILHRSDFAGIVSQIFLMETVFY